MPGSAAQVSYAAKPGTLNFFTGPTGAVTNSQVLAEFVVPWNAAKIGGCEFNAGTAGTGAGMTQLDILLNGTSVWTGVLASRPTLNSTTTGRFAQDKPAVTGLRYGDVLTVQVSSITGSTGHARISGSIAVEGR